MESALKKEEALARRIYDVIVENGSPMNIKQIAEKISDKPETTIRGRIYDNLKKFFKRVTRGVYWVINAANQTAVFIVEGSGRDMSAFEDESADAIVTDHPWEDAKSHNGGNRKFVESYEQETFRYQLEDFVEKARVLKPGGFLVEVLPAENENNFKYLYDIKILAEKCGLHYYAKVPWKKGTFVANTGRKSKNTEEIMFFTKGKPRSLRLDAKRTKSAGTAHYMSGTNGMLPTEFDFQPRSAKQKIHQAEKPVELYEAILEAVTMPGELVIDQYAGSGNLGKAALNKGRLAVLFEILKENVEKIVQNLGAKPLNDSTTS